MEQETPWLDLRKRLGKDGTKRWGKTRGLPHAPDTDSQPLWLPWICVSAKASPRQCTRRIQQATRCQEAHWHVTRGGVQEGGERSGFYSVGGISNTVNSELKG